MPANLPQDEDDEGKEQQASNNAVNQNPQRDGDGAALQNLQYCLHTRTPQQNTHTNQREGESAPPQNLTHSPHTHTHTHTHTHPTHTHTHTHTTHTHTHT